ncbi:hypothetical protein [Streptomyces sp. NA02950]|uniref:hypothetical protein n=1 Tax=Streptomyces sp. NA02950 TaxID=2742137 RepID=UPI0020CB5432|nr:hypothetical protein [Streptomyces sp. NA02950]
MPGLRPGAESGAGAVPDPMADPARRPAAEPVPKAAEPLETAEAPDVPGAVGPQAPEAAELPDTAEAPTAAEAAGPADPAPLGVPRTPTGVPEVDARLDRLADADHLGTGEHLEVYEDVHQGLRDTLTALDRRPGPPTPAPHGPA